MTTKYVVMENMDASKNNDRMVSIYDTLCGATKEIARLHGLPTNQSSFYVVQYEGIDKKHIVMALYSGTHEGNS